MYSDNSSLMVMLKYSLMKKCFTVNTVLKCWNDQCLSELMSKALSGQNIQPRSWASWPLTRKKMLSFFYKFREKVWRILILTTISWDIMGQGQLPRGQIYVDSRQCPQSTQLWMCWSSAKSCWFMASRHLALLQGLLGQELYNFLRLCWGLNWY